MHTENYVQMMIDSLKMKKNILQNLMTLNENQSKIASEENFREEDFQGNIDNKDTLIDNLVKLDEGFQSVFVRVKQELEVNRPQYSEEIKIMQDLIKEITELSVKVEVQESRNKTLIQNRFSSMRHEIKNAKRSSQMANNYYKNMNKIDTEPQLFEQKQ